MASWSDLSDDELGARLAAAMPDSATTDGGARRIAAMVLSRDDEDVAAIISDVLADGA